MPPSKFGWKFKDLSGQQFGRLTVLAECGRDAHGNVRWKCHCSCGEIKVISGASLRRGLTRSCGCFIGDSHRERAQLKHEESGGRTGAFRLLVNQYRSDARDRGHAWELSDDLVASLTSGCCRYCGKPPSQTIKSRKRLYIYNGIDRVDNRVGYVPGNVVPCCGPCNRMKRDMSADEFFSLVSAIYEHSARPQSLAMNHG